MKQIISFLLLLFATEYSFAQTDTLYTIHDKIPCVVKEVTPEAVMYTIPGQELINTAYRSTVHKIVFQDGLVQTFIVVPAYRKLRNIHDFENVTVTQVENEVEGLYKVSDVTTSAQVGSLVAGRDNVQERALREMKIIAAMMGANVVYLTYLQPRGTDRRLGLSGPFQHFHASTVETFLSGVIYTNELLRSEEFKSRLAGKTVFRAAEKAQFAKTAGNIKVYSSKRKFTLKEVKEENGHIVVAGALEGASNHKQFRVASFDKDFFYIYYQEKGVSYSVKLAI
jgi:hypothetical protein